MPANKQLAEAVLATFREVDPAHHASRLRAFSVADWNAKFHWLDASGLALYFLKRLQVLGIEQSLPGSILSELEKRCADNRVRTPRLFEEFVRLNRHFKDAGISYLNLKGFTLLPDYYPDPSLRHQVDCDFLVAKDDAPRCSEILNNLGYGLVTAGEKVMEFKTGDGRTPRMKAMYEPPRQYSVEIHLSDEVSSHPYPLRRVRMLTINGCVYPALSIEDMFVSQVRHTVRHLCSEWTRISWLLELKYFLENYTDDRLWRELAMKVSADRTFDVALGIIGRLADMAFGSRRTNPLVESSVERLPAKVALWVEQYGRDVLISDFPGTKLYLLLQQALGNETPATMRKRLFPLRLPGPVVVASAQSSRERVAAFVTHFRYFFFRLRFHAKADWQYGIASWRWKRLCDNTVTNPSSSGKTSCAVRAGDQF